MHHLLFDGNTGSGWIGFSFTASAVAFKSRSRSAGANALLYGAVEVQNHRARSNHVKDVFKAVRQRGSRLAHSLSDAPVGLEPQLKAVLILLKMMSGLPVPSTSTSKPFSR